MPFSCIKKTSQPRFRKVDYPVEIGGFGHVYRYSAGENKADVAMKTVPLISNRDGVPSDVLREISILKELEHDNIVRLLEVDDVKVLYFNLCFEWIDSDLNKMIKNGSNDPHLIKSLLYQTLQGVSYCHSQKILHRDLKPHNLLVDPATNRLKLADFGLSRTFDDAVLDYSTEGANYAYRAPELLLLNSKYTTAVDVWSVGCIFAEMVTGKPLFSGTTDTIAMRKIIKILGVPNELDWPGVKSDCLKVCEVSKLPSDPLPDLADVVPGLEPEGLDLLSKMLCMVPGKRISAFNALHHPYFNDLKPQPSEL